MMNGRPGKFLVFQKPLATCPDRIIRDIPLGNYSVQATIRDASGNEQPLFVASREMISSASRLEPASTTKIPLALYEGDAPMMTHNGVYAVDLWLYLPKGL
jgi:beta-lactamase class D